MESADAAVNELLDTANQFGASHLGMFTAIFFTVRRKA